MHCHDRCPFRDVKGRASSNAYNQIISPFPDPSSAFFHNRYIPFCLGIDKGFHSMFIRSHGLKAAIDDAQFLDSWASNNQDAPWLHLP
jgi:hypothetical protein